MTEIRVCIGSSCHLKGSYNIIQTFQQMIEEYHLHDKIVFQTGFCMRQCGHAGVTVTLNGVKHRLSPDQARSFFLENVLPLLGRRPEQPLAGRIWSSPPASLRQST